MRTRMTTEERREHLLNAGVELLRHRHHEDVSIEDVAEAAGVSKGLLYHYFPTKRAFIVAALERERAELYRRMRTEPQLDAIARLDTALSGFLDSVEEHTLAYRAIFKRRGGDPEVTATVDAGRDQLLQMLVDGLAALPEPPAVLADKPALETALEGWLSFCEGAVLRWLEHDDLEREELQRLLRTMLIATLSAASTMREDG